MDTTFRGRVVVVTGGTSGIGEELVRQLANYGARIYIGGRNTEAANKIMADCQAAEHIAFASLDVRDAQSVQQFIQTTVTAEGRIDFLFHSVGTVLGGEVRDNRLEDIQQVLQTNTLGAAYVAYETYRVMAEQGAGQLVLIASTAGLIPIPLMGVYSASKFAVVGLGESLRIEARGLGVTISTVTPGFVGTPLYERAAYSKTSGEKVRQLLLHKPLIITPQKAARRILKGTRHKRAIIHTNFYGRPGWWSYRFAPWLYRWFAGLAMGPYRRRMREEK